MKNILLNLFALVVFMAFGILVNEAAWSASNALFYGSKFASWAILGWGIFVILTSSSKSDKKSILKSLFSWRKILAFGLMAGGLFVISNVGNPLLSLDDWPSGKMVLAAILIFSGLMVHYTYGWVFQGLRTPKEKLTPEQKTARIEAKAKLMQAEKEKIEAQKAANLEIIAGQERAKINILEAEAAAEQEKLKLTATERAITAEKEKELAILREQQKIEKDQLKSADKKKKDKFNALTAAQNLSLFWINAYVWKVIGNEEKKFFTEDLLAEAITTTTAIIELLSVSSNAAKIAVLLPGMAKIQAFMAPINRYSWASDISRTVDLAWKDVKFLSDYLATL